MTRAMTAPELVHIRKSGQFSRLYLAGTETPAVVFSAQINQTFSTTDKVASITYDNVTAGAYTDMLEGQTVWIGSSAGLYDIGQARVRKEPSSTVLYIGETSSINFADNLFITVIDEFSLWAKHPYGTSIDYDIAYSDQHENFAPDVCMGANVVLDVATYPVTVTFPDTANSQVFGSSISAYSWSATAGTFDDSAIQLPTLTIASYPTNGYVRVTLTISGANGTTGFGYRFIRVYDSTHRPVTQFTMTECGGTVDEGGFSFSVTMYAEADTIRDRAPMTVFATDYYGTSQVSIGQAEGRENIVCTGWVDGETIEYDSETSRVSFTVKGAAFWLTKLAAFPVELLSFTPAAAWNQIPSLTVDLALWHIIHWRSTIGLIMDVVYSGDVRLATEIIASDGNLWGQVKSIAYNNIFANVGVDQYGRMYVSIDPQMTEVADRTWASVMEITKQDYNGAIRFGRMTSTPVSSISASGYSASSSGSATTFFSLSNGHIPNRYGNVETLDMFLVDDQTQANTLTGLYSGWRNNEFPSISISLASNNRMVTLFPNQYIDMTIDPSDNARGVSYEGFIIPRSVDFNYDETTGMLTTELECEAVTTPDIAITGDIPLDEADIDISTPYDDFEISDIPIFTDVLPPDITNLNLPSKVVIASDDFGILYSTNINNGDISKILWQSMNSGLSPTDISFIEKIVVTPNGTIYVKTLNKVFAAQRLGGAFKQIAQSTDFPGLGDIFDIAVNPLSSDEIAMIGGEAGGFNEQKIKLANYSGITTTAAHTNGYHYRPVITFANNKWYVIGSDFFAVQILSINNAGLSGSPSSRNAPTPGQDQFIVAAGSQDLVFFWNSSATDYKFTTDPVDTFTALSINIDQFTRTPQSISPSPTGQYIMAADGVAITPKVSTDYGATWGTTSLTIGPRIWENCRDNNRWLFGSGANIKITLDRGATEYNLIGNLLTIAPLINIVGIRFIA